MFIHLFEGSIHAMKYLNIFGILLIIIIVFASAFPTGACKPNKSLEVKGYKENNDTILPAKATTPMSAVNRESVINFVKWRYKIGTKPKIRKNGIPKNRNKFIV